MVSGLRELQIQTIIRNCKAKWSIKSVIRELIEGYVHIGRVVIYEPGDLLLVLALTLI